MKIILASASPRRSELLSQAGLAFEVIPSQVEEKMEGETPSEVVMSLARQKAGDVFDRLCQSRARAQEPDRQGACVPKTAKQEDGQTGASFIVLGADTIVVCDGKRLGKPKDCEEAMEMLEMLGGRSHEVYTGVALYRFEDGKISREAFAECTKVSMYPISKAQARWYVGTGEPMDKAGAYGIQGKGAVFIRGIEGDYNNVVGLPLAKVWHMIGQCEDV